MRKASGEGTHGLAGLLPSSEHHVAQPAEGLLDVLLLNDAEARADVARLAAIRDKGDAGYGQHTRRLGLVRDQSKAVAFGLLGSGRRQVELEPQEHACHRRDPLRHTRLAQHLARLGLKVVAALGVVARNAVHVAQEARDAPVVEQLVGHHAGHTRWLQVRHGRVGIDSIQDLRRSRGEAKSKAGGQNLGEALEAHDTASAPSLTVLLLKTPIALASLPRDCILVQSTKVEVVVWVVLQNEEVVLAGKREDLALAIVRRGGAGRVGARGGGVKTLGTRETGSLGIRVPVFENLSQPARHHALVIADHGDDPRLEHDERRKNAGVHGRLDKDDVAGVEQRVKGLVEQVLRAVTGGHSPRRPACDAVELGARRDDLSVVHVHLKLRNPLHQLGDTGGGTILECSDQIVSVDGELGGARLCLGLDVDADALEGEGLGVGLAGKKREHARDGLGGEEGTDRRRRSVVRGLAQEACRVDAAGFGHRLGAWVEVADLVPEVGAGVGMDDLGGWRHWYRVDCEGWLK
ncbi:hypothetical protein L1887_57086 [Cichorium endivia]|nr:hypothetical protein L1887_57086 [Cichorium endivia]